MRRFLRVLMIVTLLLSAGAGNLLAAKKDKSLELLPAPSDKARLYVFTPAFVRNPRIQGFNIVLEDSNVLELPLRGLAVLDIEPGKKLIGLREIEEWVVKSGTFYFEAGTSYYLTPGVGYDLELIEEKAARKKLKSYKFTGAFSFKREMHSLVAVPKEYVAETSLFSRVMDKTAPAFSENSNGIAVIIGNRNYSEQNIDAPDVDYAVNDAKAMKEYVSRVLGFSEKNTIYLEDATQTEMIKLFGNEQNYQGQVYDWVRSGQSELFIFYSGHGAPSLTDGKGYLLPIDGDPNKVELTGYPLETLYKNLGQVPAKSFTIVIDACFSGVSQGGAIVKDASSIALRRVGTVAALENSTILTAAGLSEVASWDEEARHGLFTRHFLEGVSGKADTIYAGDKDGKVTLGELKVYLENEVTYNARRSYGREQHPQVTGDVQQVMADLK